MRFFMLLFGWLGFFNFAFFDMKYLGSDINVLDKSETPI